MIENEKNKEHLSTIMKEFLDDFLNFYNEKILDETLEWEFLRHFIIFVLIQNKVTKKELEKFFESSIEIFDFFAKKYNKFPVENEEF